MSLKKEPVWISKLSQNVKDEIKEIVESSSTEGAINQIVFQQNVSKQQASEAVRWFEIRRSERSDIELTSMAENLTVPGGFSERSVPVKRKLGVKSITSRKKVVSFPLSGNEKQQVIKR